MSLGTLSSRPIGPLGPYLVANLGLNLGAFFSNYLEIALVTISLLDPIALRVLRAYIGSIGLNRTTLLPIRASF